MPAPTLIVGAGPGGLAVARAFKLFGVPYVQVERHTAVGGIWDADNPGTSIYESAHFISSKTCSAFHGMPMLTPRPKAIGGSARSADRTGPQRNGARRPNALRAPRRPSKRGVLRRAWAAIY
jgi:cation diffusion facilitator CzcD-associated flavoprotein CzcO